MMRRALLSCALFVLVFGMTSCTMWGDKPVKAWASATGGEHLERLFWDTLKAKDWIELEKHVSPDFVYVGPSGAREKADAMKFFESLQIADLSLGDMTVHPSGGDVVVVTYLAHINATRDGKPLSSNQFRVTSTWQKIGRDWMLIARAHTPPAT